MGIFKATRTPTHQVPGPLTWVRVSVNFLKGVGMGLVVRLSEVRSLALPDLGPDRTDRQVRGSGPEIAGPDLC